MRACIRNDSCAQVNTCDFKVREGLGAGGLGIWVEELGRFGSREQRTEKTRRQELGNWRRYRMDAGVVSGTYS